MVNWKFEEEVWELELSHPPCNEIGTHLVEKLEEFLKDVQKCPGKAVIIYSTVPKGFSAGADLKELQEELTKKNLEFSKGEMVTFLERIHRVMLTLDTLPIATIAAVHGVCFGGGFELALTCDLIIAEKNARFAFPELRLGIIPAFGGIPRLERNCGNTAIFDLLLTGRSINAKRAEELGIVSMVVGPGEALETAKGIAEQVVKMDPTAMQEVKRFIKRDLSSRLEEERNLFLNLALRPAFKNSLDKFVKRTDLFPYLPEETQKE